ncbi:unnamed protein product [Caenorhabditis auriculariae]|uniref:G-protein coupled receptors family 1 profile domain-containing protein n=1 Tax=Caenorhabditis auriculariae TaxID=2777116 RepID=A0A8S1GWL9_9PELO|nr:unnamed protein product [Caenorhabditis auriculariae]
MSGLQTLYFVLYFFVPLAGIVLNGYVLSRLLRVAKKSAVRFETTSGLPLAAMTGGLYLVHTSSAFSVWCWLVLSILRYTAVFHPIKYRTIWRQPRNGLKALALSCCIFESWILFFVVFRQDETGTTCSEKDDIDAQYVKLAHLGDVCFFYAIPSLLRITLDFIVLLHCYSPFSVDSFDRAIFERRYAISGPPLRSYSTAADCEALNLRNNMALALTISSTTQVMSKKRAAYLKRKTAMVMRSIVISVLNILLNLPAHILRVWATLDNSSIPKDLVSTFEPIVQILYFSQFACNAFYLATSIYETSETPRSTVVVSSGRHVSRCISEDS